VRLVPRTFDPPLKVPIGEGYELVVVGGGPAARSGVTADLQVWNGDILHADRGVVVSSARVRRDFGNDVGAIQPAIDRTALDTALLKLAALLPEKLRVVVRDVESSRQKGRRSFRCTDLGNAERFVARYAHLLRYCPPRDAWYVWDGQRWKIDTVGSMARRAAAAIRAIYREAARPNLSHEESGQLARWAHSSESSGRLSAMLELAKTQKGIPVLPDHFDRNPWLLNCLNGTVDLRTGALQPHRGEDLISRLAPVVYDPDARLDLWERFVEETTGGNSDLSAFLQRAVGYSLTADTSEEVMFFGHGPEASGKSTLMDALCAALGDYAYRADFETFVARRDPGVAPRPELIPLIGARFVASVEAEQGRRLALSLFKQLVGADEIPVRDLFKPVFTFRPVFKLWLMANDPPRVNSRDSAAWRRILRIQFEHTVPAEKRDPMIKKRLRDPKLAGPAVLAWAVRGCQEWQRVGLGVPQVVREATQAYRDDQDPLRDFLTDCCHISPEAWAPSAALWQSYSAWVHDARLEHPLSRRAFGDHLTSRGWESKIRKIDEKSVRCWVGVGLLSGVREVNDTLVEKPSAPGARVRARAPARGGSDSTARNLEFQDAVTQRLRSEGYSGKFQDSLKGRVGLSDSSVTSVTSVTSPVGEGPAGEQRRTKSSVCRGGLQQT
jgi:putative DNA primase/helicase